MIHFHWNALGTGENKQARQEICNGACVNERISNYEWEEIDAWLQDILKDSLKTRSKGTVKLEA